MRYATNALGTTHMQAKASIMILESEFAHSQYEEVSAH